MYATLLDPLQCIYFFPSLSPLFCLSPLCSGAQNRACFSLPVTRILSQNMTQYRALLLFFIIYTMCPTQSHIIQLWKPWCNSIHIKAACLSAAPSPKNLHIYCPPSLSRSATSLPSATWKKKKRRKTKHTSAILLAGNWLICYINFLLSSLFHCLLTFCLFSMFVPQGRNTAQKAFSMHGVVLK